MFTHPILKGIGPLKEAQRIPFVHENQTRMEGYRSSTFGAECERPRPLQILRSALST